MRLPLIAMFCACLTGNAGAGFKLLVTETQAGSNPNPMSWQGVRQFDIAGSGGMATPIAGIPANQLSDPAGLALDANGKLFVGNRHGNSNPSTVSRFNYNVDTGAATADGNISGNSLFGVHGVAFNPVNGEMFAANVGGPVSRFTFDGMGNAVANGTVGAGLKRGVAVSATGDRLYMTTAGNVIQRFDLAGNMALPDIVVPGAFGLHDMSWGPGGDLYAADFGSGQVYRVSFDGMQNPTVDGVAAMAATAIDVAFSPDGAEMFVSGHTSGLISRFSYNMGMDTWTPNGSINVGVNMGALLVVVPEPATLSLAAAAVALLARRKPLS